MMNSREPQTVPNRRKTERKKPYEAPRVLASYDREELEAALQPEGGVGGCGCSG